MTLETGLTGRPVVMPSGERSRAGPFATVPMPAAAGRKVGNPRTGTQVTRGGECADFSRSRPSGRRRRFFRTDACSLRLPTRSALRRSVQLLGGTAVSVLSQHVTAFRVSLGALRAWLRTPALSRTPAVMSRAASAPPPCDTASTSWSRWCHAPPSYVPGPYQLPSGVSPDLIAGYLFEVSYVQFRPYPFPAITPGAAAPSVSS